MGGTRTILAEVAGCFHDAPAEMLLPDAIHHHPRRKRIVRTGDPFRQSHAPPARRELPIPVRLERGRLKIPRDSAGEPWFNSFARLPVVTTLQYVRERNASPIP